MGMISKGLGFGVIGISKGFIRIGLRDVYPSTKNET